MSSYTVTEATTFTITHARHIAAKVATDLKRMQRFYGAPSDAEIDAYEAELTLLLREEYIDKVTYGFRRENAWIPPTISYRASDLAGETVNDDDPGRVQPGADARNAGFYSYLSYSAAWDRLPEAAKQSFKKQLPFQRSGAPEPAINGYLQSDRTYSAGGRSLVRASVRACP